MNLMNSSIYPNVSLLFINIPENQNKIKLQLQYIQNCLENTTTITYGDS